MPTVAELEAFWLPALGLGPSARPSASGTVTPWAPLGWLDPQYFVTGTGTQIVATAGAFVGDALTYSLVGSPPAGVSINASTGQLAVSTTTPFEWTTITVRAANSLGYADATIDLWVFTPTKSVAAGAPWSSITPSPGDIIVVRGGTYTSVQNISTWDGASTSARTRVVAYPGETITFDCSAMNGNYYILETNNANNVELRGFRFVDDGGCYFALWNNISSGMKLAQCDFGGFYQTSICLGQGTRANAGPWALEYNRFHDCTKQNVNGQMGAGGWSRGMAMDYCDGSTLQRNRIYRNWGEGLGIIAGVGYTIDGNISYDNWSVNMYLDGCQTSEVHNNIVWSNDATYYRAGSPAASIRAANEDYNGTPGTHSGGLEQATTGLNVTGNKYLSSNAAPQYFYYGGSQDDGGPGTSVFTPNETFTTPDTRWY